MPLLALSCLFLSTLLGTAVAHGVSNTTRLLNDNETQIYVGYVSNPSGRGTYSLVISCLLTLILCVWSALHLNVPPPAQSPVRTFFLSVRWIITGIYAPELVVFTAWRQWSSARILSRIVRKQLDEGKCNKHPDILGHAARCWTLRHSFFASTGGFVFEFDDDTNLDTNLHSHISANRYLSLPSGKAKRVTITAKGMALLARCGRLPDIPEGEIADKSKANALAKFLVVLQASWMLLQVSGRLIAGLPVTLLEVNTVAHVLCAFCMYTMWWHKPLTAKEPIILRGAWVDELLAFMYMSSEMSRKANKKSMRSQTMIKTLFASLHLYSTVPEMESLCFTAIASPGLQTHRSFPQLELNISRDSSQDTSDLPSTEDPPSPASPIFQLAPKSCATLLKAKQSEKEAATAFFQRRPRVNAVRNTTCRVDPAVQRRWSLAAKALKKYSEMLSDCVSFNHQTPNGTCIHYGSQQLVASNSRNWPGDDLLRDVGGLVVGMIFWLANFLYGGIHAAAWNGHFPSDVEKWFWRASACYICFCGGLWVILNFTVSSTPWLNEFWEKWMNGEKKWWHNVIIGTLVFICGLSLMVARAYIMIEAFVSIRQLPARAYETPTWTNIFPHL